MNKMKEDLFISIMQKNGVSDETSIHNAYLDILHEIEKENVVKKAVSYTHLTLPTNSRV